MVRIRPGRRLAVLAAVAALAALSAPAAPASALSVTVSPTLPAPLAPNQLPLGGSLSGGTDGTPIDVTVTVPGVTGIEATLPGVPSVPALPAGPTGSVPIIGGDPAVAPAPASSTPRDSSDPAVAAPGDHAATLPSTPFQPSTRLSAADSAAGAARPLGPPISARGAKVSAAIDAQPADSWLQRVPAVASRVALWAALAAILFALQMLVTSALGQRRNRAARVS